MTNKWQFKDEHFLLNCRRIAYINTPMSNNPSAMHEWLKMTWKNQALKS